MSLLLDALKKAADDKKKNLVVDEIVETSANTDESLELDLNLDSNLEETSTGEDFPEVDESSIHQAHTKETLDEELLSEPAEETESVSVEVIPEEAGSKTTKPIIGNLEAENDIDIGAESPTNSEPEPEPITTSSPAPEDNSLHTSKPISTTSSDPTKNIEKEQALLALINKSNQHSKQARYKKTITITILIALLLIGSGLFFYIKMDTASQDIFIANNNHAPVNRALETKSIGTLPVITETEKPVKQEIPPKKIASTPIPKKTKPIHIVHTEKQDPVSALILEAYNQFQRENYEQANKLYNQVILREPKNRDALLGLSAIAIKQQRYEFARQKYQYLLRLNPKDSIAIAGISSIKNDADSQLNESQIKFMLKEKPDSAPLYFALGTLYSSHKKWPEAQSAYFSAWSTENKNADYAYNLAVSLDHLDKRNQALNFYKLSLKLKQASSGNFSSENVSQRIRTLKESKE